MKSGRMLAMVAAALGVVAICSTLSVSQEKNNTPEVTILDTLSFWRVHHTVSTPMAEVDGKIVEMEEPWTIWERSKVDEGWMKPEYDDHGWGRVMLRMTACDEGLGQLCVRGKFEVTDPSKVKGLKLSVIYHGGAVLYVNGEEVGRKNVAKGSMIAESYPDEVFADKDGKLTPYERYNAFVTHRDDKLQEMKRRVLEVEVRRGF